MSQGRGNNDQWVTSMKIGYSLNGKKWDDVAQGKNIPACNDHTLKIAYTFETPIRARVVRIYPQTWHGGIAMRFNLIPVAPANSSSIKSKDEDETFFYQQILEEGL